MIFDALHYFKTLASQNKLCVENGFKPVFCSGPDSIEGVMQGRCLVLQAPCLYGVRPRCVQVG